MLYRVRFINGAIKKSFWDWKACRECGGSASSVVSTEVCSACRVSDLVCQDKDPA